MNTSNSNQLGAALALLTLGLAGTGMASAQSAMDHSKMDHSKGQKTVVVEPQATHSAMPPPTVVEQQSDHSAMNHSQMEAAPAAASDGMRMGPMQGGSAPPDARDPDAYAEGTRHANLPGSAMHDDAHFGRVVLDKFEYAKGDGEQGLNIDGEAWYGGDYNKLWLNFEGERRDGRLQSARKEVLWDHAIAPFWSSQLGVRHDSGGGPSRSWAAFGVRGLAPYWFDTSATAYWRSGTGAAARLNLRYEVLFTQRLILEPEFEANLYSRADPDRDQGDGLSDVALGLRLRYEVRRQFAPYLGVTWERKYGKTADFARAKGERVKTVQFVGGVRLWF